jgi:putative polyketide hydroxylase
MRRSIDRILTTHAGSLPRPPDLTRMMWDVIDPRQTFGRPGSRAPHIWLERDGRSVSTIDLTGESFVLLAGPEGGAWRGAAQVAEKQLGVRVATYQVGADLRDPGGAFAAAYGLSSSGATLIRPDGFVAWRARSAPDDPARAITSALWTILMPA